MLHVRSRAPSWSTLIASRLTGIPYIGTYHTIYREQSGLKNFYNSGVVRGARVIAVGDETAGGDPPALSHPGPAHRHHPPRRRPHRVRSRRGDGGAQGDAGQGLGPARRAPRWRCCRGASSTARATTSSSAPSTAWSRAAATTWSAVCAGDDQGRSRYREEMEALVATLGLQEPRALRRPLRGHAGGLRAVAGRGVGGGGERGAAARHPGGAGDGRAGGGVRRRLGHRGGAGDAAGAGHRDHRLQRPGRRPRRPWPRPSTGCCGWRRPTMPR